MKLTVEFEGCPILLDFVVHLGTAVGVDHGELDQAFRLGGLGFLVVGGGAVTVLRLGGAVVATLRVGVSAGTGGLHV